MKKEKLILICVIIIAAAVIVAQVIKQSSIERQANAKIEQERQALEYQKEQDKKADADKAFNKIMTNACIEDAEDAYWTFVELNGKGKRDDKKGVTAPNWVWDDAKEDKTVAIDNCYRKYNN